MAAATRGLGSEESRLATPGFAAAVRWARFAEKLAPELTGAREVASTDPPKFLLARGGQALIDFNTRRKNAREAVKRLEAALLPPDDAEPEPDDA